MICHHRSVFEWNVPERFNFARDVVEPRTGPAITFVSATGERRELSFEEVNARAAQWTNRLARAGVEPGDRVLVLVGKTPEWHPLMLAALRARRRLDPLLGDAAAEGSRLPDRALGRAARRRRPTGRVGDGRARRGRAVHGQGRARRGVAERSPRRHGQDGHRVHPLHVRDDQGPEGRRPYARLLLREADAGGELAERRDRATSSGARPPRAGRSRSGTSCSARGASAPRSSSTRARSIPRSGSACSRSSA